MSAPAAGAEQLGDGGGPQTVQGMNYDGAAGSAELLLPAAVGWSFSAAAQLPSCCVENSEGWWCPAAAGRHQGPD